MLFTHCVKKHTSRDGFPYDIDVLSVLCTILPNKIKITDFFICVIFQCNFSCLESDSSSSYSQDKTVIQSVSVKFVIFSSLLVGPFCTFSFVLELFLSGFSSWFNDVSCDVSFFSFSFNASSFKLQSSVAGFSLSPLGHDFFCTILFSYSNGADLQRISAPLGHTETTFKLVCQL